MTSIDTPTTSNPKPSQERDTPYVFPLDGIDLSAQLLDRAEIERWNPQRAHMAMLDAIVWQSPDYIHGIGVKHVRDDEFWVSGHFPGRPLLPGVLMVEAAAQIANYLFFKWLSAREGNAEDPVELEKVAGFTRIENTIFRDTVTLGDDLYLLSLGEKVSTRRFVSKVQGVVRGRIVFETRITGMLF